MTIKVHRKVKWTQTLSVVVKNMTDISDHPYNLQHYTPRVLHKLTALDVQTVSQIITTQLTSCACDHYSEDLSLSVRKMSFVMRWLQNPAFYTKATKTAFWTGRDVSWAVNCGLPNAKPSFITRVFYVQFIVYMVTPGQVFCEHFRLSLL